MKLKAFIMAAVIAGGIAYAYTRPAPVYVTYSYTVESGDTIWSIASKFATNEDKMADVVDESVQANGIKDAGNLQPGQVLNWKWELKSPHGGESPAGNV